MYIICEITFPIGWLCEVLFIFKKEKSNNFENFCKTFNIYLELILKYIFSISKILSVYLHIFIHNSLFVFMNEINFRTTTEASIYFGIAFKELCAVTKVMRI